MVKDDIVVRIAGEGGEGVISTGELLAKAMARASLNVFAFQTYPAEIKGGPAMFQVRAAPYELHSHGGAADLLVAFNAEAWELHGPALSPEGVLLYDSADPPQLRSEVGSYAMPLSEIAATQVGMKITKNVVALGAAGHMVGVPLTVLADVVRDKWAKRGEKVVAKNLEALSAGYSYAAQHISTQVYSIPQRRDGRRPLLKGNQALAIGALVAGCRYYAGYPITPASDILEWMATNLPLFGGVVIQTEDEMAALASCIGASFAGAKAMTATSGPGLSLMAELIGLASITEIPVVIVDAQRGGPSTGMPTKTEQSDLNTAVFGGHGDAPRIVLAPSSVEDCLFTVIEAFNLAEKYQMPVIVLTDQYLAQRTETISYPDLDAVQLVDRLKPNPEDTPNGYRRYALTESGVSPMALPGMPNTLYVAEGLEHDEFGHPNLTPANHMKMTEKRFRKLRSASQEKRFVRRFGHPDAEIGVVCWGSALGPVREAAQHAEQMGVKVSVLHVAMVNPLPEEVEPLIQPLRVVIVPELNYTGQFAQILQARFHVPIRQLNKVDGLPFQSREILDVVMEVANA
ncbi:MAG: 2-oxoacid:acceptor oxidoreductase subunit alpha [Armatimonadota bacterium]